MKSTDSRKKRRGIRYEAARRRISILERKNRELLQMVSGVTLKALLLDTKLLHPSRPKKLSPGVIEMLSLLIEELSSMGASSEEIAKGVANLLQSGSLKLIEREPSQEMVDAGNTKWHLEQNVWMSIHDGARGDMYRHVWAVMHDEA